MLEPTDLLLAKDHNDHLKICPLHGKEPPMCTGRLDPPTGSQGQAQPKYRGICTCVGNPLFTNTPMEENETTTKVSNVRQFIDKVGRPYEHPLYQTSSGSTYGRRVNDGNIPVRYFPKEGTFTSRIHLGINYSDSHFTTSLDNDSGRGGCK